MFHLIALCALVLAAVPAAAQSSSQPAPPAAPAAPSASGPAMVRDASGAPTVKAIRLAKPLDVDGKLDDDVYSTHEPFGDLVQVVPQTGQPATERTDLWLMFDEANIYVAARVFDSAPPDKWIANEYRRDSAPLRQNDHVGIGIDTFLDRRSGFMFYASPLAAFSDYSVIDEGQPNSDWNPVWNVRTGRFDGGWTMEMIIPFKSLRFHSGKNQTWGFQVRRSIRRRNEWAYLTALPASMAGPLGLNRVSLYGTATGIDVPEGGRRLEVKPYLFGRDTTDRLLTPPVSDKIDAQAGLDVKYGITPDLVADLTYNTDFAQVEVDEQQVNLTRFSLLFPEKRDFFLEGRGIFDFGRGGASSGGGGGAGAGGGLNGSFNGPTSTPQLFYSRRIGLNRGRVVPMQLGARVTGKVGKFGVGLLNVQADDEAVSATPSTNFTVVRVKRDILKNGAIGAMFTERTKSNIAPGGNQAYGVDAAFGFFKDLTVGAYWARTGTEGVTGDDDSYQGRLDYFGDRYGAKVEYLKVGDNFNPEIGFVPRDNFKRSFASLRFSPRPKNLKGIRKLSYGADLEYLENATSGVLETRVQVGRASAELENSDFIQAEVTRDYEFLPRPFAVVTGVTIPAGGYSFDDIQLTYTLGAQRRVAGSLATQLGHFWNGDIRSFSYTAARVSLLKQFSVEPTLQYTKVDLPQGDFVAKLLRTRADYAFSPRMFASALVQYNATDHNFSSNLRFRWEYKLGSEFFVVYTDERDTLGGGFPALKNRAFVVKATRFFRF